MHECIQQFIHQLIHQYIHSAFVSNYLDFFGQISSETGPQLAANDFEKRPDRRFKFNWQSLIKGSTSSLSLSSQLPPSLSLFLYEWLNINFVIFIHTQWARLLGNDVILCVELTLQLALSQESHSRESEREWGRAERAWVEERGRQRERERALVELLSAQLFFAAALLILWNKAAFPFGIFIVWRLCFVFLFGFCCCLN